MLALSRITVLIMMRRHGLPDHTAEENPSIASAFHERKKCNYLVIVSGCIYIKNSSGWL